MKVLMLGWELPPYNSGGLGVACYNLGKSLSRNGVDIDFVVPYLADHKKINFMNVVNATNLPPFPQISCGAYSKLDEKYFLPDSSSVMIREIQSTYCDYIESSMDFSPDCIHVHDWLTFEAGIIAKKRFGVPLGAHVPATEYDRSGMNGGNRLIHEIERLGLTEADRIFAVSEATKFQIHEKYNIPLEKIDVAYNSLDEEFKSSPNIENSDLRYLKKMKSLGYTIVSTVGRFTIQKGLWYMMNAARRALEKNPKLIFVFAGDGEERNELISNAAKFGISKNIVFTGFVRGQELRDIYSISDIFVMSSISEPFGLTALEAAYFNNALVLTKQSGVSEVLKSAIKYNFWDEEKLADIIVSISSSPSLEKHLKHNIKLDCEKLSWDNVAKKILKTYKELKK